MASAQPAYGSQHTTERTILDALHRHYGQHHMGSLRYVVAEHVKAGGAWDSLRTADFIAMDMWKTGHFSLHGHEVKCSRADWLRELHDPSKAAEFTPYMNYWWIVAGHERIVRDGELPAGWGLLVLNGDRFIVWQKARRTAAEPLSQPRVAALLRATQQTASYACRRAGQEA